MKLLFCLLLSVSAFGQDTLQHPGVRAMHILLYHSGLKSIVLIDGTWPAIQPLHTRLWAWNGRSWSQLEGTGPEARYVNSAVYDTRRNLIVSFGGRVGKREEIRGDTWEYSGKEWLLMSDTSIGPRDHHSMVYDVALGKTFLFGGGTFPRSAEWLTDTWQWDGLRWTKIAETGPEGRVTAMVYDLERSLTFLFGGIGDSPDGNLPQRLFNDTWVFNGSHWEEKKTIVAPPVRSRHALSFDVANKIVLLYGGAAGPQDYLGDMWKWDGVQWSEIKLQGATPGKRCLHAMVYDPYRKKTFLYGGNQEGKIMNDLWEWDGHNWKEVK